MRKLILLTALMVTCNIWGYDFKVDGLCYRAFMPDQVRVTYEQDSENGPAYAVLSGAVDIPSTVIYNETEYQVTEIDSEAFKGCSGITSIYIPASVKEIGFEAFKNCTALNLVTIESDFTKISSGVFDSTALYADASNWINGVLYIDHCIVAANKENISGNLAVVSGTRQIAEMTFMDCAGLTSVIVPDGVNLIGMYAFAKCENLTAVNIGDGLKIIDGEAFRDCSALTSVRIPASLTHIGMSAFYGCSALTEMVLPQGVQTIEASAFSGCKGLTEFVVPDSVKVMDVKVLSNCIGLKNVVLPKGVTNLELYSFGKCTALQQMTVHATVPPVMDENAFFQVEISNVRVYVPQEALAAYQTDPYWREFDLQGMSVGTGISETENNNGIYAVGNILYNPNAFKMNVYNVQGTLVYSGKDIEVQLPATGVYVVKSVGNSMKVVM